VEVELLFCALLPISGGTHRWQLRVKGKDMARAEVEAVFLKD